MINELPILEKLKMRHPDLYKKDLDCIRCNKKKEILSHIWECSEVNNLIVMFELELKEWLNDEVKKLNNISHHDSLLDKLYKYTHFKITLKEDRKSTRLNSSHDQISYAVFCLKKKKIKH